MPNIQNLKAQMITQNQQGQKIKRNFNNLRTGLKDDELKLVAGTLNSLLDGERLMTVNLTAKAALNLQ